MTGSIVRDGEWPDTFEMVVVRDRAFIEINTASQCRRVTLQAGQISRINIV